MTPVISNRDRTLLKWLAGIFAGCAAGMLAVTLTHRLGFIGYRQEHLAGTALSLGFVAALIVLMIVIVIRRTRQPTLGLRSGSDLSGLGLVLMDAADLARIHGLDAIDARCLLTAALDDLGVEKALTLAAVDPQSIRRKIAPENMRALEASTYRVVRRTASPELTRDAQRLLNMAVAARGTQPARPLDLWLAATTADTDARVIVREAVSTHALEVAATYVDSTLRPPEDHADGLTPLVVHDDDVTPMNVVRDLLIEVLGVSRAQANELTMRVHHQKGAVVVGRFPAALAEEHAATLVRRAREEGYPLRAAIDEEDVTRLDREVR